MWEQASRAGERFWEQAESEAAKAGEHLVGSGGFAALLGQVAENIAALSKLSGDALDLAWRNLRIAGRRDVVRLARQLGRTEDKLERVLQEVEALRDAVEPPEPPPTKRAAGARAGETTRQRAGRRR